MRMLKVQRRASLDNTTYENKYLSKAIVKIFLLFFLYLKIIMRKMIKT